jgi:hypothetical protein
MTRTAKNLREADPPGDVITRCFPTACYELFQQSSLQSLSLFHVILFVCTFAWGTSVSLFQQPTNLRIGTCSAPRHFNLYQHYEVPYMHFRITNKFYRAETLKSWQLLSRSRNSPPFMEPEVSLSLYLRRPATVPCYNPDKFTSHSHIISTFHFQD